MKKGFTLIELLVTISIIAVLATIGLTSFGDTRGQARDTKRKQDLQTLATALEIYFQKNNKYPDSTAGIDGTCASSPNDTQGIYTGNKLADFLNQPPTDPQTGASYCYISLGDGKSFRLFATLENCSSSDTGIVSGCPSTYNFSVTSQDLTLASAPESSTILLYTTPASTYTTPNTTYTSPDTTTPTPTPTPTPAPACSNPARFYPDLDHDNYGQTSYYTYACSKPAGYASRGGDCYDFNRDVHPGAGWKSSLYYKSDDGTRSWDWDCSGWVELEYGAYNTSGCVISNSNTYTYSDPSCTQPISWSGYYMNLLNSGQCGSLLYSGSTGLAQPSDVSTIGPYWEYIPSWNGTPAQCNDRGYVIISNNNCNLLSNYFLRCR
ncbi:MAG: type II secretion system protein [Patescibacteria group bacterium]